MAWSSKNKFRFDLTQTWRVDQINSKLEITTDGLSEIEKRINSFQDQESHLKAEVLDLADQKANRDEILDEVKVLTSQKEEITQYNLQYQNAESKLEEARNAYSQIKLDERKERVSLEEKKRELQRLQNELRSFANESRKLNQIKEENAKISSDLSSKKSQFDKLTSDIDKLEKLSSRLKEETNDLEVKSQKYHTYRVEVEKLESRAGELSATQTKLKKVESELVSLNKERDQIQADSDNLSKKKDILAKAVTPEWGTIHSLSLSIIIELDRVNEFIAVSEKNQDAKCKDSLKSIQESLTHILADNDVEILNPQEGSSIKEVEKDQIEILSGPKKGRKPIIVKSISKPGYICKNGGKGKLTVLRKAEVITIAS